MIRIVGIFLVFACVHSLTVTSWFKQHCRAVCGDAFMRVWYRFLYNAASVITAVPALYLISQVPDQVLWRGPFWIRWPLHAVQLAGFVFGALSFKHLDAGEFLGLRQIVRYRATKKTAGNVEGLTQRELVTDGVYGIVRHPIYFSGIIIFTFNPLVTRNGLIVSLLADVYFLSGMFIEERRFLRMFGGQYREYMKRVPRLFPRIF